MLVTGQWQDVVRLDTVEPGMFHERGSVFCLAWWQAELLAQSILQRPFGLQKFFFRFGAVGIDPLNLCNKVLIFLSGNEESVSKAV